MTGVCDDCGATMRYSDSGHSACLYCRLPDILDQAQWVARIGYAPIGARFTNPEGTTLVTLCTTDGAEVVAHVATRAETWDTWSPPTRCPVA